jgi:outer membrane protein TolC
MRHYPRLKAKEADVELAVAGKFHAATGLMPRVKAGASALNTDNQVAVFGMLLEQKRFTAGDFEVARLNGMTAHTNYNFIAEGEVPFFDAFQTVLKVKAASHRVMSSKAEKEFTRMEAIFLAAEIYARAAALDSLIITAEGIEKSSYNDIGQAEDLNKKGLILGADFYAAKTAYGAIKIQKNSFIEERKSVRVLMNILSGDAPDSPLELAETVDARVPAVDLNDCITGALKTRPDMVSMDEVIGAQKNEVDREKMSILPRINGFGGVQDNTRNFSDGGVSYALGVKGEMDIFDVSYFARVKEAKSALKKLEAGKKTLADKIAEEITGEYYRLSGIRVNLPVVKAMCGDAGESVRLMEPIYREGRKSIADLIGMRSVCLDISKEYSRSVSMEGTSYLKLLFLSGAIDEKKAASVFTAEGKAE